MDNEFVRRESIINTAEEDITLGISVEGQTEAYFAKYVLGRYLAKHNIKLGEPIILGGNVTFARVTGTLALLADEYDYATSLYDFYGFQGKEENDTLETLLKKLYADSNICYKNNIYIYLQKYEYEALLFSNLDVMCNYFYDSESEKNLCKRKFVDNLKGKKPEDVNDSIQTAPSKRIKKIYKRYQKIMHGYIIAQEIGIERIRAECPLFNSWVEHLLGLSKTVNK